MTEHRLLIKVIEEAFRIKDDRISGLESDLDRLASSATDLTLIHRIQEFLEANDGEGDQLPVELLQEAIDALQERFPPMEPWTWGP